jgi:predicted nucleotidyltransferase
MNLKDINIDRKVVVRVLTGSNNYNLNDEISDKDYKFFVLPNFDDLYNGKCFYQGETSQELDYTVHDLRKLPSLLYKSNMSFLEILFSKELIFSYEAGQKLKDNVFKYAESIASINLPRLFNSCWFTHMEKYNKLLKGTATTQNLVDKFGYDTKQALHCYRYIDFLDRYIDNGFTSFNKALWYTSKERELMLDIKHGKYTLSEFEELLRKKREVVLPLKESYQAMKVNSHLEEYLNMTIKDIVCFNFL